MAKNSLEYVFDESKIQHEFLEVSKFDTTFPKRCINYLQSVESFIKIACERKKIKFEIDYEKCTMEVSTTSATRDPYAIIKAQDFINLLSKSVLLEQAVKIFNDDIFCDIIPIMSLVSNEKVFEHRRNRIVNPKVLKAIELLTNCHVLISGKYACIIGVYKGVNTAKNIIIQAFEKNIHPVFEIKRIMIKNNLQKDSVEGDWKRFLPEIAKTHSKKPTKSRETRNLPEDIKERKEDIQRATGEYYLDPKNIEKDKAREARRAKREQIRQAKKQRFEEPEE